MPTASVEVRRHYSVVEEVAILDAVHGALVVAFAIPPRDRHVRLVVHEPHRFAVSPEQHDPERYTLVTVDCFEGRSLEAKRRLYREVVERLAVVGIDPRDVTITLREGPTENWGVRGGRAACDVDLGFTIEV